MPRLLPLSLLLVAVTTPHLGFAQDEAPAELPPDAPITKLPTVKTFVDAVYPKAAVKDQISARVVLEIDIGVDGRVEGVTVVESSTVATQTSSTTPVMATRSSTITDYGFTASATTAAAQLVFTPAESNGTPVPVRIGYAFNFEPPPPPAPPPPRTSTSTATDEPAGPGVVNLLGRLRERGSRSELPGVVVTVFQQTEDDVIAFEAVTDKDGRFEFYDLAPGVWSLQAELQGYYPVRDTEKVEAGKATEVSYFMEKGTYNPYEITTIGERVIKEVNRRTLTREEIIKVPGTLGDPVTVIQNLPGVARTQGGQIIVRGSGPQDTGVFIDGINVPLIFHFGGLKSVIPAEVIDTVDFYPGNYSVYYGRFTGGIFDAHIKKLEPDGVHGAAEISLLDASLFLEVPITDELSIALGGRRSYIDAIINAVVPDDGDVAVTSAPVYYDYQAIVNWRPSEKHDVRALFLGSDDALALLFQNPADVSTQIQATNFSASTAFQRGILEYRYTPGSHYKRRTQLAVGNDTIDFNLGTQFFFELDVLSIQLRDSSDWMPYDWLSISAGVDALFQIADVAVLAPGLAPREGEVGANTDIENTVFTAVDNAFFGTISPFLEAKIDLFDDKLSVVPGLRLDYWSAVDAEPVSVDPRITARYEIAPEWYVKGGVGLVHQSPQAAELDENFGNPDLGLPRAVQYSVGGEYLPTDYLKFDLTLFYKDLSNLVVSTTELDPETGEQLNLNNDGTGQVYGLEVFIEQKFHKNFRGWLSYTFSRAERRDAPGEPIRLFDFDQTHILTLVASYVLPEGWEFGVRWRIVSGNPTTPFTRGIYDSDIDEYLPIPAATNSSRLPFFHQLDLRVDKTWVFDTYKFSAFLSLLNTYNRQNTEGINYNFDFTRSEPVSGLPVLPILGVKGQW